MQSSSPFRYPGGKGRLSPFIRLVCAQNELSLRHYAEPYAGGAGVALAMLFSEVSECIHINDVDDGVAAFWTAVVKEPDRLCDKIGSVPLTMEEWRKQRALYKNETGVTFERGFATFYMNRTNRSGVIGTAGVIGGNEQTGRWKIGARFDRTVLVERVQRIAKYKERIRVYNMDAIAFLTSLRERLDAKSLVYLDPPYYVKGRGLYANFYTDQDHRDVHRYVQTMNSPWIVSYDDVSFIRSLYGAASQVSYSLNYAMINGTKGGEVMYFSPGLKIPDVSCPASIPQPLFSSAMKRIERSKQQHFV